VAGRLPRASRPEELTTPGRGRQTDKKWVDSPPPPKKRYAPLFMSEASSRDPIAFSTLRLPRSTKSMALVSLIVTL